MREILFRGKRLCDGKWTYGSLIKLDGQDVIFAYSGDSKGAYDVRPDTVGQYTGLTDENDAKIFEGDIVKFKHGGEFDKNGVYFRNYVVEFVNTFVTYGLRLRNKSINFPFKQATASTHDAIVVGNIYDNPELLKEVQHERNIKGDQG